MNNNNSSNKGGRPNKYGEPLTTVTFSCPVSITDELKSHVRAFLAAHAARVKASRMMNDLPSTDNTTNHAN